MQVTDFIICSNEALNDRNCLIKVAPADHRLLPPIQPGQFVQILVDCLPNAFLRRPISINFVDREKNELWLLIQKVGEGTREMCSRRPGEIMNLIYPLGNSFTLPERKGCRNEECREEERLGGEQYEEERFGKEQHKEVCQEEERNDERRFLLVGGGVGTAPLLFLSKELHARDLQVDFLLGGRSATDILQRADFEKYGTLYCTTEDGSLGERGFVTHHSLWQEKRYDFIYTCGPKPMMVAVAGFARERGIPCEASLENLMACGFGACLCCIEKTTRGNLNTCTEGPVFNTDMLTWLD
jgi:dihydroorotate dehydrogenase electron transfer subunit